MAWYIAKIIFRINNGGIPQFDEQWRLVRCRNEEEALLKARVIGLNEEELFYTDEMKTVEWEFVNVVDVALVKDIHDGAAVYSQTHEDDNANLYVRRAHERAAGLRLLYHNQGQ